MERREFEHIVIGLGALGSAACYWLSRRAGSGVLGLEQYELGHERGASEDHSRILRLSYHSKAYVDLAREAYDAWRTIEAESGETLMVRTGGLDLGPRESAIPMDDYTRSMDAAGVPYERLDADEIMRRWPQFTLADDIHGIFQADSGLLPASRCNDTHRRLAAEHGATLRAEARVSAIRPVTDGVEVVKRRKDLSCEDAHDRRGRVDERPPGDARSAQAPAADHPGAGHLLRVAERRGLRAGPLPGLDLAR